ncbi:hypothetical protein F5Y16DRAFT_397392 [Xylariaceae sp. FL0255]|nr:hypothetical protein F5Y16DRAFT_397392 [Xylariaceae sp. FL0255]
MSFGDLVVAAQLAWSVCKDSGETFSRLSSEVASLHVVLKETENCLAETPDLNTSRVNRLQDTHGRWLNKYIYEIRAGHREAAAMSKPDIAVSIGSPDVWVEIQRKLEGIALAQEMLDDDDPHNESALSLLPADSGYGDSNYAFSAAGLSVANEASEEVAQEAS